MTAMCPICPHSCTLEEGKLGICGTRTVEDGAIVSLSYGRATALALDPIEKKPLAAFHPGSTILSYGSYGCNLSCRFCQNSDISTARSDSGISTRYLSPEDLVEKALAVVDEGNIGIAFTYNEPFIAWEYLRDAATLAHKKQLLTVAVTNGYVSAETWKQSFEYVDAFNIDLKCFTARGYESLGAPNGLDIVKNSIKSACEAGAHVEVTTLVVPDLSDSVDDFENECRWLESLDADIPLHITRYFPRHLDRGKEATDRNLLDTFVEIAQMHLSKVFLGNV